MRLLPARRRSALWAIYGFARLADDLGDEAPGDRLAHLDALEAELDRAFCRRAGHPLLRRLEPVLAEYRLPREPFVRLIEANRWDQRHSAIGTFAELLDYCALSANPVGELVLRVFDSASPENLVRSNAICSALQVVEHLQDVAEDQGRGRIYLPAEDMDRFGCAPGQLALRPAHPALRQLVAFEAERARELLREGEPLVAALGGSARVAVAGFAAGGHGALDAIARAKFDVTSALRRPRRRDVAAHIVGIWFRASWRGGRS